MTQISRLKSRGFAYISGTNPTPQKRGFYYILALTTFAEISIDFHLKNPVFMRFLVRATIWYKPPVF